jgi:hypothetical protein
MANIMLISRRIKRIAPPHDKETTMKKFNAGTNHQQGVLHRGTQPRPNPTHAGSGRPQGKVHGPPQPRVFANHGGTALRMGVLKRK